MYLRLPTRVDVSLVELGVIFEGESEVLHQFLGWHMRVCKRRECQLEAEHRRNHSPDMEGGGGIGIMCGGYELRSFAYGIARDVLWVKH